MVKKIEQKWGFGMAPLKKKREQDLKKYVLALAPYLEGNDPIISAPDSLPTAISEVKGLFTRGFKQDQWDWFTVWNRLGRPGARKCRTVSYAFKALRLALKHKQKDEISSALALLSRCDVMRHLNNFLNPRPDYFEHGYIYILSKRENPDVLKIGYTNRSVEERIKEINQATGVLIPFGVRALWSVKHADTIESEIHELLSEYRIRSDREFFNIDFGDAFKLIVNHIRLRRLREA